MEYVGTIDNHFSTIGIVGMNEMCENFMGKNILDAGRPESFNVLLKEMQSLGLDVRTVKRTESPK